PAGAGPVRGRRVPHPLPHLRERRRVAHRADRAPGRVLRRAARGGARGGGHGDVFPGRGPGVGLQVPGGAVRDDTRPLPFPRAARAVFDLALEGMVWSRRSLMMAALLGLPGAFGILYRAVLVAKMPTQVTASDLYAVIVTVTIGFLDPLAALFYGTALIADEVEGKTLTCLLTRPVRRGAILAGKFAACLATTLALSLPSVVVTFFLLMTARGWGSV